MLGFPILYLKGMSIMMFLGFRAEGARMPMFFRKDGGVVRASKVLLRILVVTVLQRARPQNFCQFEVQGLASRARNRLESCYVGEPLVEPLVSMRVLSEFAPSARSSFHSLAGLTAADLGNVGP